MNEIFSIDRFRLLLRSYGMGIYRPLITLTLTLAFLLGILSILGDKSNDGFYVSSFAALLYILGLIFTSRAFRELHDKARNSAFLLLPASTFEKTLARLVILTVGLIMYLLFLVSLVSLIVEPLNHLLFNQTRELFHPMEADAWKTIPGYLFLQSIYFLGAAWFRSGHLVKTTLALILANLAISLFSFLVLRLLFAPYWEYAGDLNISFADMPGSYGGVAQALLFTFAALWVAICWYVAFLRVREAQVSDGI